MDDATAATTPTSTAASTRSPRSRRRRSRRARKVAGSSTPRRRARSSSCATPPRRSTSSPTRGPARTWARRRGRRCRTWSTTPTSCRGTSSPPSAASSCGGSRSPTTTGSTSRTSTALLDGAKLLAVTAMSNVLGTINDIRPLADAAHAAGALVLVDAAQASRTAVDVQRGTPTSSASRRTRCSVRAASAALGAVPSCSSDAPVPRRRRDDPRRPHRRLHAQRGAVEVRGGHAADRRGDRLRRPPSTTSALGMDAVREHEMQLTAYTLDALERAFRRPLTIYGPPDVDPRRRDLVPVRRHPRPRHLPGPRRGRRVRARRTPLRQAADAPARRSRHDRASFYVYNDEADVDAGRALAKAEKFFAI